MNYDRRTNYATEQKQETGGGEQKIEQKPQYNSSKKDELTNQGERLEARAKELLDAIDSTIDTTIDSVLEETDLETYQDIAEQHTEVGGQ